MLGLACSLAVFAGGASAKDLTFGYVAANMTWPSNGSAAKGFEEAAKKAGAKAVIINAQGSSQEQANAIQDLISQGVDAVGFMPVDSVSAQSFADTLTKAGLPSGSVAVPVGDAKRAFEDVYPNLNVLVAPNDTTMGQQSAKLAADLLKGVQGTAKIAIVEGDPSLQLVKWRSEGFRKGLDESGLKYEIVAAQPTDWTPEKGEAVCQNFLTAHPDLNLIFSHADDMAIGCARAVSSSGKDVHIVATSGGSKLGNAAIVAGEVVGSTCVQFSKEGRLLFEALHDAVTGKDTKKARLVAVETPTITKGNVASCTPDW